MEIDVFDSETIIKSYRLLSKKCDAIDRFIKDNALYFGAPTAEFGASDICDTIIDLMEHKNQLINFKLIVDRIVAQLPESDQQVLLMKMNYEAVSAEMCCGVLELKSRTLFRHIERALSNFTAALNKSKYKRKIYEILNTEDWLIRVKNEIMVSKGLPEMVREVVL